MNGQLQRIYTVCYQPIKKYFIGILLENKELKYPWEFLKIVT
jgi:hypothetical protein